MVLEFKVPTSTNIKNILNQFPYFISYTIGWLFLGESWYNHFFLFQQIKKINQKIFWANGFWLFSTSFIPLSTAWIGKNLYARGPELFYGLVFLIWTLSYLILVKVIIYECLKSGLNNEAKLISNLKIYKYLTNPWLIGIQLMLWVLILILFPQFQLLIMIWQVMFVANHTNIDIDNKIS